MPEDLSCGERELIVNRNFSSKTYHRRLHGFIHQEHLWTEVSSPKHEFLRSIENLRPFYSPTHSSDLVEIPVGITISF